MRTAIVCGGQYQIQDDGKIYRIKDNGLNEIKFTTNGYYRVANEPGVKPITVAVHRLIAEKWVANPNRLPLVNHIDGNKHNNAANNLEWVSPRENIILAYALGLIRKRHYDLDEERKERYEQIIQNRYGKTIREIRSGAAP